ncbi:MAG: adenine phosphoribosyltransferase [Cryomorphaceae bacterium]|nr:adenine phosphoribosyltransferase [Cryomorphaceae bacterium]
MEALAKAIRDIQDFPKKGIVYKDITPVFQNPDLLEAVVQASVNQLVSLRPEAIVGIEARGFLLGVLLANRLGIPFVLLRKEGKLPYTTIVEAYSLEYGNSALEMHTDALKKDARVVIHDDVLATGGTAHAAVKLVERGGGKVVGVHCMLELGFLKARASFSEGLPIMALHTV